MDEPGTPLESVAVVGLGLIGASLCLALRRALPSLRIIGVARRAEIAERALADGACDLAGTGPELLAGAELVVLCTPVTAMPEWIERCAEVAPRTPITDCGSTKAWIVERAAAIHPRGRFLGGHPMAGRESSGYDAAEAALFRDCTWVLTPREQPPDEELEPFAPWLRVLGALGVHVELLDPESHDLAVAWVSHVPFVLSAALMSAAAGSPMWSRASRLASTGFRDMVRLAGGDPAMYAAITSSNAPAVASVLDAIEAEVAAARAVLTDDQAVSAYFAAARRERARWLAERAAAGRPVPGTAPATP